MDDKICTKKCLGFIYSSSLPDTNENPLSGVAERMVSVQICSVSCLFCIVTSYWSSTLLLLFLSVPHCRRTGNMLKSMFLGVVSVFAQDKTLIEKLSMVSLWRDFAYLHICYPAFAMIHFPLVLKLIHDSATYLKSPKYTRLSSSLFLLVILTTALKW